MKPFQALVDYYTFYHQDGYNCIFLPGIEFPKISHQIDHLRCQAFSKVAPECGLASDHDGRDPYYWHILILDAGHHICAGQRLRFSEHDSNWGAGTSYLEYSYPGLASYLNLSSRAFVEVGRVFVSPEKIGDHRLLPLALKLSSIVARHYNYNSIISLMSYVKVTDADVSSIVLLRILQRAISLANFKVTTPLFPSIVDRTDSYQELVSPYLAAMDVPNFDSCIALAKKIIADDPEFSGLGLTLRVPPFLRIHALLSGGVPIGLSEALGYNQIHEILMLTNLGNSSKGATHQCVQAQLANMPVI